MAKNDVCCFGKVNIIAGLMIAGLFQFLYDDYNIIFNILYKQEYGFNLIYVDAFIIFFTIMFFAGDIVLPFLAVVDKMPGLLWFTIIPIVIKLLVSFSMMVLYVYLITEYFIATNWTIPYEDRETFYWTVFYVSKDIVYLVFGSWSLIVFWSCKSYLKHLKKAKDTAPELTEVVTDGTKVSE